MDDSGDSGELELSDDFELEVTDLDTGQRKRVRLGSPTARDILRRRHAVARNIVSRVLAACTHRTAPAMVRRSPLSRARLVSAAALVVVLLITAVVFGSDPSTVSALSAFIRLPFTTHTAPANLMNAGEGSFLALDGVPWGTLLLDGKPDPRANTHLDIYQGTFTLAPGRHTLEYRAEPFPTLRCVVTVPVDSTDTCPLVSPQQLGSLTDPFPPATRMLDLRAAPSFLSPTQQEALVDAIQTALTARAPVDPVTVLPGERYVTASGSVAIATQPLLATYLYEFQWDPHLGLRDCSSLCVRHRSLAYRTGVWVISAHVRQGWRYSTPEGAPVIPLAPPIATNIAPLTPSGASATDIFINVYARWTGQWTVSTMSQAEFGDPYSAPTCAVGFEALLRVMGSANVSFTPIPSPRLANGCLFLVQHFTQYGSLTGQPLYYFFRFGVLLTVNALARAALPSLPAAGPAIQSLARLIATQTGHPSP